MGTLWTHVKVGPLKSFALVHLCSNKVIRALNNHLKGEAENERILRIVAALKEYAENSVQSVFAEFHIPSSQTQALSLSLCSSLFACLMLCNSASLLAPVEFRCCIRALAGPRPRATLAQWSNYQLRNKTKINSNCAHLNSNIEK